MGPGDYQSVFGAGRRGQNASISYGSRAYEAGRNDSRDMGSWQPPLASPDAEILYSRDKITARARDMDRNSAWFHGGVDMRTDAVIGAKIRLEARPDFEAMGRTAEWAEEWAVKTEARFRSWANDSRCLCDVERHLQFGGLARLAYTHYVIDGEACAAIYDLDRGGSNSTAVLIVDPDRLSNKDNAPDSDKLRGGVRLDERGAAIGYDVRVNHPNDVTNSWDTFRWETIPREGETGRPRFVHAFSKRRAQQRRGVSDLATAIPRGKMLDRYDKAELEAALWNAVNAFVIESPFTDKEVQEALAPISDDCKATYAQNLLEYRERNKVAIGNGVQGLHLVPGEKASMLSAERPAGNFPAFESAVLRSISPLFKLSHPQFANDWTGINYSSARTLLNEIWRGLMADRHLFSQMFLAPIYAAWLEMEIAMGMVKVPGGPLNFYKFRAALTASEWIGPGRGKIDPVKESTAGDMDLAANRSSLQMQTAEQGVDVRDVMLQRSREMAMAKRLGLPEPAPVVAANPAAHADPNAADNADAVESAGAGK